MRERFSKIFELWNQRNTEYYKRVFQLKEQQGVNIFNYTACFFPTLWMVHRKMYVFAVLWEIVYLFFQSVGWGFVLVIGMVLFGRFGNRLYLKEIKSRIKKGYNEITDYNPISPLGCVVLMCFDFLVILCIFYFSFDFILSHPDGFATASFSISKLMLKSSYTGSVVVFILILWAIDYKKFHHKESSKEINEQSVNKYLEKSDPRNTLKAAGIFIIVYIFAFVILLYKIKHIDKETIEKLHRVSAILRSKNPTDSKIRSN